MKLTLTEMFTAVIATEASVSFSMVYNKLRPQQGVGAHAGAPSNGEAGEEDQPKSEVSFLYQEFQVIKGNLGRAYGRGRKERKRKEEEKRKERGEIPLNTKKKIV